MIYFFKAEQNSKSVKVGWIKIGSSARLSIRIKEIAAEIGHMPTMLAIMDGGAFEESLLHQRFASLRKFNEWFVPGAALLDFIVSDGREWDGDNGPPPKRPVYAAQVKGDIGPTIIRSLIRLGYAHREVKLSSVCDLIKERTGKTISRQRLAAILKANSVEDGTIEMIAKGVGVSPAELLREK